MPATLEARVSQHDREIAAIRKLLLQGAKMLVQLEGKLDRLETAQVRSEKRLNRLEAAQARTDKTLDRFIRSLERGRNGHTKTDIH